MDKTFNTAAETTCVGVPTLAGLNSKTPCAFTNSIARPDGVSLEDWIAQVDIFQKYSGYHILISCGFPIQVKNLITGETETLEAGYHNLVGYTIPAQTISNDLVEESWIVLQYATLENGIKLGVRNLTLKNVDCLNLTTTKEMFATASARDVLDLSDTLFPSLVDDCSGMFMNFFGKRIILPDTLSGKLMNDMFNGAYNLTEINLNALQLSYSTTIANILKDTTNLTNPDISSWVTWKAKDWSHAFDGCGAKTLDVKSISMNRATTLSYTFANMPNIENLSLLKNEALNITTIDHIFYNDVKLTSATILIDLSKLTNLDYIFDGCTQLASFCLSSSTIPTSATTMICTFMGTNISEIRLPKWIISKLTSTNSAFSGCSNTRFIDISGINLSKVTDNTNMFYGCSALVILFFGTNLKISLNMADCTKLTRQSALNIVNACADLTGGTKQTLTLNNNIYLTTAEVAALTAKNWAVSGNNVSDDSNLIMWANCETTVTKIADSTTETIEAGTVTNRTDCYLTSISGTPISVSTSPSDLSSNGLTYTVVNNSTAYILVKSGKLSLTDLTGWMAGKTTMGILDLCGLHTGKITSIKNIFNGDSKATKIDLSMFDLSECTETTDAFKGCTSLIDLRLGTGLKVSLDLSDCPLTNTSIDTLLQSLANATDSIPELTLVKTSGTSTLTTYYQSTPSEYGFSNLNWTIYSAFATFQTHNDGEAD